MRRLLAAGLLLLLLGPRVGAQGQEKVIDVRTARPAGNSFEALWTLYRKAGGDAENSRKVFEETRRLRTERNIRSLEEVGLALVASGLESLEKGDRARAEEEFRRAIILDPQLPDGYFGLALTEVKRGPFGFLTAVKDVVSGLTARLSTSRGRHYFFTLLVAVGLVAALATATVVALALLLRHGTLLLHDLEESFGPTRGRAVALGIYALLLLAPLLTFQGYAWLPLWWLALVFIYASMVEKVVILLTLAATVAVGPVVSLLEARILAIQNPLHRASMLAIEGGPDRRAIADLEAAVSKYPDDLDLVYLLAMQYKKAGQYDDAAALYKEILRKNEKDAFALNNLGNLEFATGEFPAALTRYKLATEPGQAISPGIGATVYYNLSLAYLQTFERQPADEARSQADRLDGGLIRVYDQLWKYEAKNEDAVVDLCLTQDQAWAKFSGVHEGVGLKNVAGKTSPGIDSSAVALSVANRFAGFLGVFGMAVYGLGAWRGKKMFTMRCLKCGTPFCKRCHLGAAPAGLCTQCYHLFVVRDGVSGPARNQKLMEVQKEDERRERVFRALSLLSPGAGHIYAQKTVVGALFALVWYALLAVSLLAGRLLPVTEAPAALSGWWTLVVAALLLLITYVAANRARPDFEVAMPAPPRGGPRRARAA